MDLIDRAGDVKRALVEFALSPRFDRELGEAIEKRFPAGIVTDEAILTMTIDQFVLEHRFPDGTTVIDRFLSHRPELPPEERAMLLAWKNVVEGVFEVQKKDGDAVITRNVFDELTYRLRSNMGKKAFRPIKTGMFLIGRAVPLGEGWMVSGNFAAYPSDARDTILASAARQAMQNPAGVFRNPDKLALARKQLAEHREVFVDLFGEELIIVPAEKAKSTAEEFFHALAERAGPGKAQSTPLHFDLPSEMADAETVGVHFDPETGLSFYIDFGLAAEVFQDPRRMHRRRFRECLTGYLHDDSVSPKAILWLVERYPDKASTVFAKLLKKPNFSWERDGEAMLRRYKAACFDTPEFPRNVPLSDELAQYLRS